MYGIGTAYAPPRSGVAAIILGQVFVAAIVDTTGWGPPQQIPLTVNCVIALVLLRFLFGFCHRASAITGGAYFQISG
jgi:uncharacterized membrane protein YdcZ (DUF606 family)